MGLLTLIPLWGRLLAVALLVAAVWGHGYVKGNEHGTAKLTEFVGKQAIEENRLGGLRRAITDKLEAQHANDVANITNRFNRFIAGLQHPVASAKPVSVAATICNDATADQRLSDLVSEHFAAVRRIIATEREGTVRLLEQAQIQTNALSIGQDWIRQQSTVK